MRGVVSLAPQRSHPMTRVGAIEYAKKNNLAIPQLKRSTYSTDENLWGRSIEGGDTEVPAYVRHDDAFVWTVNPTQAPDKPVTIELVFEKGIPIKLNGKALPLWVL